MQTVVRHLFVIACSFFVHSGTAAVTVAGLLAADRLTGRKLEDNVFLFVGAGEVSDILIVPFCLS